MKKPRDTQLYVKLSTKEKEAIQRAADRQGLSMSAFVRQSMIKAAARKERGDVNGGQL